LSTTTKPLEEPLVPLDEPLEGHLPTPIELSPEQAACAPEAEKIEEQYRREWAKINQTLRNNSLAVTRAISRWYPSEGEREEHTERLLEQFANGAFLVNRLGAAGVTDQDLVTVLLHFRRGLIAEYGSGPASMMLIDRAVAAYQDFIRVEGWAGNLSILIEAEFFGVRGPSANFKDRYGREGRSIRGLTVEEHLARLRASLLPLSERCGRVMREALASLETLRVGPSQTVERSRPVKVLVRLG
jgi:hypothetical protein